MSVLSTLDLRFRQKQYAEYAGRFGKENVILIKKSKLFLRLKIILPILFWTIALIAVIFLIYEAIEETTTLFYRLSGTIGALWLVPNVQLIRKILDYMIDFIIITPSSLIRYDQAGIFSRSSKTIELRNLKTASVRKTGVLNSLFNNGDLLFLAEGGFGMETHEARKGSLGEIVFRYVYDPEKYRKEINRILDLNIKEGLMSDEIQN